MRSAFLGGRAARSAGVLLACLCLGSGTVDVAVGAPAPAADPDLRAAAAQRGLAWLLANADSVPDSEGTPTRPFTLAVTGLDLLLDAGEYAPRGASARLLATIRRRLATYLASVERRVADPAQLPDGYGQFSSDRLIQTTWPLALHAWLLGECAARGLDAQSAKQELRRIARLLEEAQHTDDGWGHGRVKPGAAVSAGYPPTLIAPTNCAAVALALIDRALGRGTSEAAARAAKHYDQAVLANGNTPYDVRQRQAHLDLTGVGRSAGAVVALSLLGRPAADPTLARAAGYLRQHWDMAGEGHGSPVLNLLFAALAARLLGPQDVRAFEAAWLPGIVAQQAADGSLRCTCAKKAFGCTCDEPEGGLEALPAFALGRRAYVTALSTFVLLLDGRRLRLLEPGPGAAPAGAVTPREPR